MSSHSMKRPRAEEGFEVQAKAPAPAASQEPSPALASLLPSKPQPWRADNLVVFQTLAESGRVEVAPLVMCYFRVGDFVPPHGKLDMVFPIFRGENQVEIGGEKKDVFLYRAVCGDGWWTWYVDFPHSPGKRCCVFRRCSKVRGSPTGCKRC